MGDIIELVREAFKSRDALIDLEALFDEDRETSAHQDLEDYFGWVDRFLARALERGSDDHGTQ